MSIVDRLAELHYQEEAGQDIEDARQTIKEKVEKLTTNLRAPLLPFETKMVELGKAVSDEHTECGLKNWMVFQHQSGFSPLGARLTQDRYNKLDFRVDQWNSFIAKWARVDTYTEYPFTGGPRNCRNYHEAIRFGSTFYWINDHHDVHKMACYSSLLLDYSTTNSDLDERKWSKLWTEIEFLNAQELTVDSGTGYCDFFSTKDSVVSTEKIEQSIVNVYHQAKNSNLYKGWRFDWDKPTKETVSDGNVGFIPVGDYFLERAMNKVAAAIYDPNYWTRR